MEIVVLGQETLRLDGDTLEKVVAPNGDLVISLANWLRGGFELRLWQEC